MEEDDDHDEKGLIVKISKKGGRLDCDKCHCVLPAIKVILKVWFSPIIKTR